MIVFISGPYSKPDPCVNTHAAIKAADSILDVCVPFVPHLTHFWHTVSPKPYEQWLAIDLALLRRCDALWRLPGDSAGADSEVEAAYAAGIPVFFDEIALREWLASG